MDRRSMMLGGIALSALACLPVRAQGRAMVQDSCDQLPLSPDASPGTIFLSRPEEICAAVSAQLSETHTEFVHNRFNYRSRIFAHSRVDSFRDPGPHVAKKVQAFWLRYEDQLICNMFGSMVRNGSLLKLAVEANADQFLNDVVRRWGLWLNHRDESGETVLDFAYSELIRERGTHREAIMRRYATLFERFGAKRAADLTAQDIPPDPMTREIVPLLRNWDRACYFNEGLAAVKRGDLCGYVDANGTVVVPPRYHGAFAFSQGRAAVHRDGEWGYIDATGGEVIPLAWSDARVFAPTGVAEVTRDGRTWRTIDRSGAFVSA